MVALRAAGVGFTVHEYAHDPRSDSFGLEAASELGLDPDRVYKTLMASADGALVVAVVPVSGRLYLKALARALLAAGGLIAYDPELVIEHDHEARFRHCLVKGFEHAYPREEAAFPRSVDRASKYWPPVRRIDGAYGDRNLICSCPAPEAFE